MIYANFLMKHRIVRSNWGLDASTCRKTQRTFEVAQVEVFFRLRCLEKGYAQTLLLTGARTGEVLGLRWDDIKWLEIAAGVVAQIMGHKPSATAEKHYTVRPLDLLRLHHKKIEAWILEQAGVTFDAKAEPGALRVVIS
jgi:integrase